MPCVGAMLAQHGSSPRARGTAHEPVGSSHWHRFIPACAGNSEAMASRSALMSVHPRVRGEQQNAMFHAICGDGSSPRARGTGLAPARRWVGVRFIPACAGNRGQRLFDLRHLAVHPRVRGEQAAVRLQ